MRTLAVRMTRKDTTHGCTTVRADLRDGGRVMASLVREALIEAPAARCWDAIRDFGALPERLARGFVTHLTMTGDRERTITFFTGAVATELLIGLDEPSMRLAYTVTAGPLKAAHYNAAV